MKPIAAALCLTQLLMPAQQPNPAFASVEDTPGLPRVLLIGDSISIGYTLPVRELLKGKANVHRVPTNGGPTINGIKNIDTWLGEGKWDVIHFNFGLHDIRLDKDGKHQVEAAEYEANLRKLVARLKKTGARLIWASTTPVPEGRQSPSRMGGDEVKYNDIAQKVMKENEVPINDLHAFAAPRLKDIQMPANVHFTKAGSEVLAREVAARIEAALRK